MSKIENFALIYESNRQFRECDDSLRFTLGLFWRELVFCGVHTCVTGCGLGGGPGVGSVPDGGLGLGPRSGASLGFNDPGPRELLRRERMFGGLMGVVRYHLRDLEGMLTGLVGLSRGPSRAR